MTSHKSNQHVIGDACLQGSHAKLATDAGRIFVTAILVYAAFWNPWLHSSMAWNYIDMAVSFVDTGRWELAHPQLYSFLDTATVNGRVVTAFPSGLPVLIMPFYIVWLVVMGPVGSPSSFQVFNGFLVLILSTTASALTAVQVYWLTGWLGASRRGRLWATTLFALGTPNFAYGTMLFKENIVSLAVISAVRVAVQPGTGRTRALSGFLASTAPTMAASVALFPALPLPLILRREGVKQAAAFCLGAFPLLLALGSYGLWIYGSLWRPGHLFLTLLPPAYPATLKFSVLLNILLGPQGSPFLYSPFLLLSLLGLLGGIGQRTDGERAVTAVLFLLLWLEAAWWLSQFEHPTGLTNQFGSRYLFPVIPLLSAFAGPPLERLGTAARLAFGLPSALCGYLAAQAGMIPGPHELSYALKTLVSGTGMGVLFKEALPAWLGFETFHTVVSRPDVSARDLIRMLPTPRGLELIRNQAVLLAANVTVLAGIGWIISRLWRTASVPVAPPSPSLDGQAAADHHRS